MLRPPAARREAVRTSKRYQLLSLAEALRQESRSEGFRDVARAIELAELSAEVAECLDPEFYGRRLVADTRGMAWAMVGNAWRIAGDLFGAERALQSGLDFLDGGTGSASERAEAQSLLASLRIDQSRFSEAISLLEKAVGTYRRLNEPGLEGRTLIKLGSAAGFSGSPLQAVEVLRPAIDLLTEVGDLHAAMLAKHNIAWSLAEAGKCSEAAAYLETIRAEYDLFPDDRSTQIRRRWLEGRIHEGLGELYEAAAALREVRSIFAEEERAFDNALVTLDLAADSTSRLARPTRSSAWPRALRSSAPTTSTATPWPPSSSSSRRPPPRPPPSAWSATSPATSPGRVTTRTCATSRPSLSVRKNRHGRQ